MKRTRIVAGIIFVTAILLCSSKLIAQNISDNRNNIEISISSIKLKHEGRFFDNHLLSSVLGYSYNINELFTIGAYCGIGKYEEIEFQWVEENHYRASNNGVRPYAYLYGLSGKIHLLPLLTDKNKNLDLFINSKLGFIKMNSSKDPIITPAFGNYFDATFNGGCTLYLSKHFGISAEAGYKYLEYHKGFNARFGFLFSF